MIASCESSNRYVDDYCERGIRLCRTLRQAAVYSVRQIQGLLYYYEDTREGSKV